MIRLERSAMVWGIVGSLGGGKTLTAVRVAVEALERGFFVVSNITLNIDYVCKVYGERCRKLYLHVDLTKDDPFEFPSGDPRGSGGKRRVLVVLDECAEFFDQYSSQKESTKRFWSWLRHSSKRSQDVFFIVQRQEYLTKSLRSLIIRWVWCDDLAVWKFFHFKLPFMGGFIMQNVFDRLGSRVQGVDFVQKSIWGRFYNTAECISTVSNANYIYELPPRKKSNFIYALFFLSFCALLFF